MFSIVFMNDTTGHFIMMRDNIFSLEEAARLRRVSGDLVVNKSTWRVEDNDAWLWEWEKNTPSYARRNLGKTVNPHNQLP